VARNPMTHGAAVVLAAASCLAAGTVTLGSDAELPSKPWLAAARDRVVDDEYRVTWQDSTALADTPAAWHATNRAQGIRTVLWATGFKRRYDWLDVPVLDARGELLIDGGFAGNHLYAGLLAALRQGQTVMVNGAKEGTATGASLLATWHDPEVTVPLALQPIEPLDVPGLQAYATEWRRRAESG